MKLRDFLKKLPEPFAVEILQALPAPDRRELLRQHDAKVPIGAGSLKRSDRLVKETRLLLRSLENTDRGTKGRYRESLRDEFARQGAQRIPIEARG